MKTTHLLRLALCGAAALLTPTTFAQTWQTVDDFQYAVGTNSYASGLTKDPAGNIYAVGDGRDAGGLWHALAMKSSNGGANWSTIDDYRPSTDQGYDAGLTADGAGTLYAAGFNNGVGDGKHYWLVRRSLDGVTWSTVDDFTFSGSVPRALTTDSSGNVYVVGGATIVSTNYWIVRKGTTNPDGSMAWSIVDAFVKNAYNNANGCFSHPTAGLFVVGSTEDGGQKSFAGQWIVRRSLDHGATWTTVDAYQLSSNQGASASGIGADASGNIYVVGNGAQKAGSASPAHWIVRKSSNGGSSWTTVDNFIPSSGQATARGFAADSVGNLFVIGNRYGSLVSSSRWVVRKNPGGVGSWSTVDDFQYASGQEAVGQALVADLSGNVFGAGYGKDAAGVQHWLVRKGTP